MSKITLREYTNQLGAVLKTKDVQKLTDFIRKYCSYSDFPQAPYEVRELTMWKMIANRTDMPNELVNEACNWLLDRGYNPEIRQGSD